MNSVNIVGRLTRDPEQRATGTGMAVTNFTVAVDAYDSQKKERSAEFIDCVVFGKQAEFLGTYGAKGRLTAVSGRLQTRKWEDEHGNKRKSTEVVAERVELLGPKNERTEEKPAAETEDFSLF